MGTTDRFEATVSRLYESILDPDQWMGALGHIAQIAQGSRAARFRFSPQTGEVWDFS